MKRNPGLADVPLSEKLQLQSRRTKIYPIVFAALAGGFVGYFGNEVRLRMYVTKVTTVLGDATVRYEDIQQLLQKSKGDGDALRIRVETLNAEIQLKEEAIAALKEKLRTIPETESRSQEVKNRALSLILRVCPSFSDRRELEEVLVSSEFIECKQSSRQLIRGRPEIRTDADTHN